MPSFKVLAFFSTHTDTPEDAVCEFLVATLLPEAVRVEVHPADGGPVIPFEGSVLTEIAAKNNASLARLSKQRMEYATKLSALDARLTGNLTDRSLQQFGEMSDDLLNDLLRIIRMQLS